MREYSPKDIVREGLCVGCGVCAFQNNFKMQFDQYGQLKPIGSSRLLKTRSENFSKICPFSPNAENEDAIAEKLFPASNVKSSYLGMFFKNYVGYTKEAEFRAQASSGGMASWVATQLLKKGYIDGVAHVVASKGPHEEGRFFYYRISRTEKEISEGAKSRYYPVELSEILKTIENTPGRYAIVAIPCMIKAIQLIRGQNKVLEQRICYTLGLFCGHMKSARFVESFSWQMHVPFNEVEKVDFRYKIPERPANWYNTSLELKSGKTLNRDWWHLVDGDWGAGFFMNHACNFCDDVVAETADISFGDAWLEPYASDGNGTNVIVVRNPFFNQILLDGASTSRLFLKEVEESFVIQTQAAGFRQRREGLAYRLSLNKLKIHLKKRVDEKLLKNISKERKEIYKFRYFISKWSHRIFYFARLIGFQQIYLFWARVCISVYYGNAYHKGSFKEIRKRFFELKS